MTHSHPLFVEIYKNASRFTQYLTKHVWYEKNPNLPLLAVARCPYSRFWSACKEIYSRPDKDGIPRGEKDPVALIEKGLKEIRKIDIDKHFWTQTKFIRPYKHRIDHVFLFENLREEVKQKCDEYNIVWHRWFDWNNVDMNPNPSDHTNDKIAIEYIKGIDEVRYHYDLDFDWYNSIINNNL